MKKWNEISNNKKIISIILLFVIFISFVVYLKVVLDEDNYETTIHCGNGENYTIPGNHKDKIREYCGDNNLKIEDINKRIIWE
jgi:uncharacterized membrane protein SpoIIM required for sporulation